MNLSSILKHLIASLWVTNQKDVVLLILYNIFICVSKSFLKCSVLCYYNFSFTLSLLKSKPASDEEMRKRAKERLDEAEAKYLNNWDFIPLFADMKKSKQLEAD